MTMVVYVNVYAKMLMIVSLEFKCVNYKVSVSYSVIFEVYFSTIIHCTQGTIP